MMDNYNYPVGTDTKDAPWNERENDTKEFDTTFEFTLTKTTKIETSDYIQDWDYVCDDETGREKLVPCGTDTSGVDWFREYSQQHLTPFEIIQEFKRQLPALFTYYTEKRDNTDNPSEKSFCNDNLSILDKVLSNLDGWEQEEGEAREE